MLFAGVASWSCSNEYDDTPLRNDLADLKARIEAAQTALATLNSDLKSYQKLIEGLDGARYITSVSETEGAVTITYNDGTSVTLTPGTKGETGDTGAVGPEGDHGKVQMPLLKIDPTDGYWYISYDGTTWTQLLDEAGNPVQGLGDKGETGETGSTGATGTAPTLGINDYGFWTIDLGDGNGPQPVRDANGNLVVADPSKVPAGYFLSATVSEDGEWLQVVLLTGEELQLPIKGSFLFSLAVEKAEAFEAGETRTFALTQSGIAEIAIERPKGWQVKVTEESVVVTAPTTTSTGEITLYASTRSALLKLVSFAVSCQGNEVVKFPAAEQDGVIRAFPGAEGGGMYTTGGRGGQVVHVTNLNDSGAGSLREAVEMNGPRTIVFDVCGTIELKSELRIGKKDVTIAGQTAPGEGITLANYSVVVTTDNVIIRYLRFRMGDAMKHEGDAIWGRYHENIIIDHCSMSWSTDECASFYGNKNFTMQWCLIGESLKNSVHGKGSHGYGGIWGGKNASFHHNILTAHSSRNPRFCHPQVYGNYLSTHRGNVDYRNNVVNNWGDNSSYGGESGQFNMVNNYYKPGPASKDRKYFLAADAFYEKDGTVWSSAYPQLFVLGNVHTMHSDITADNQAGINFTDGAQYTYYNQFQSAPFAIKKDDVTSCYTSTHTAEQAYAQVLDYAGASLRRDAVDVRLIDDARNGKATYTSGGNGSTNGMIDTQTAVGGWPTLTATSEEIARMTTDTDKDGIPDYYEELFGLDKTKADATLKTLDPQGLYTNFECYLHYLVQDIVLAQTEGGNYTKLD